MDFMTAVRTCLSKYVDFSGRARRSEFWWFALFTFLVGIVTGVIDSILGTDYDNSTGGLVNSLGSLALLLPSLAVAVRRLHDTGRSGWWILLGLIPGAGGTQRLARLVGPAKAKDIIFTGRQLDAEEALAIGMVDRVVPAAEVYDTAVAWAAQFVSGPALALRAAKEAIDHGLEVDLATGLEIERQQFAALFATEDRASGIQSFVDNGPGKAVFRGR